MTKRRALILAAVFAVLAALIYLQFRTWKTFDWAVFWARTQEADPRRLLAAVALIYAVYYLRAVRWRIFLKPVCKASAARLTPPQFIGFTGLALLGRPGEFIRPYLIARRENLTFPSQIAVWMVERIFDTGSVALLLALALFSGTFSTIPFFQQAPNALARLRYGGYILIGGVALVAVMAFVIRRNGNALAEWIEGRLRRWFPHTAHRLAHKVRSFGEGLNTLHSPWAFAQLLGISFTIWLMIGLAYVEVTRAYPDPRLHGIVLPHVVLLMVASMAGSMLQLPGVGGGSQLATIAVLAHVFVVPQELAVSCGVMLWVITFMAVIPAGLVLARREHISLREIEAESQLKD
ncbi:MAG TPA: lysylphosphatidylglycerol synthase transmembrane domain-containing protein [Terriglobales bacterium]|nr:lysylphosphatidylglycerol synthase transmembrane domain-containing protein [Terriglobales bacterium]